MSSLRNRRGSAMLEAVVVLPVLTALVVGSLALTRQARLQLAARWAAQLGARAAAVHASSRPCAAAQGAVAQSLAPWGVTALQISCFQRSQGTIQALSEDARPTSGDVIVRVSAGGFLGFDVDAAFPVMYAPE